MMAIFYPYGWEMVQKEGVTVHDLAEPIRLIKIPRDKGIEIANISISDSRYQLMYSAG